MTNGMDAGDTAPEPLLRVEGLDVELHTRRGATSIVDGVCLHVSEGETLGIVGESGCGKSTVALAILRLLPSPPARITAGRVVLGGRDLLALPERAVRAVRGKEIGMVFQDPMAALNPAYTVGQQIVEGILAHEDTARNAARERAVGLLRAVGIPSPELRIREYPHQLSGGMRQRAVLAMALSCRPSLLIADEPTTALDVSIQAQILQLMKSLCVERKMAMLYISHDLGVIAQVAQRVAVMYAGQVVEVAPILSFYRKPLHPYSQGLLRSVNLAVRKRRLEPIEGSVPELARKPPGCRFHPRCPHAADVCRMTPPTLREGDDGRWVQCHLYAKGGEGTEAAR